MGLHPAERIREYRAKGYWNDDTIDTLLCERVRQHGDILAIVDPLNRDALVDGPVRSLTWPQLDEQVSRLAQVLLEAGLGPGDVVGVQLPNTVEIAVAFLAIARIGAIVAPFPCSTAPGSSPTCPTSPRCGCSSRPAGSASGGRPRRSPGCASRSRRCGR